MSDADRAEARGAFPAFEPKWDGSHLAWLWAFLREENAFQPWWTRRLDTRVIDDMPPPDELHARAIQFLADGRAPLLPGGRPLVSSVGRHGRGYATGLLAMLDFKPLAHLMNLTVPTLITGPRSFEAHVKLANGSPRSKSCSVKQVESRDDARAAALEFVVENVGRTPEPPPAGAAKPIPGRLWSDYVPANGGQLHLRANDDIDTVPLLVQHDAASSTSTIEPIARNLVGRRLVLAFDLPGSRESDNTLPTDGLDREVEVQVYADALTSALDTLGLKQVDFYGMWGGGFVGLDLALKDASRVRRLVMSNLFQHDGDEQASFLANYVPPVEPVWHGGHLMQAWHQMRDQGMYYPWFDRTAKGVIKREPFLATDMVHERVCSLLKAGNMYRAAYRAHFRYRTYERLAKSPVPTLIATAKWDPNNPQTQAAAKAAPNARFQFLDDDFTRWGESFLPFLESS
jgi:pimeloyl-ACP methyl ester carboxylesterase